MNKSFIDLLVRNGFSLLLILLERDQRPVDDIYILHHKQRSVPSLHIDNSYHPRELRVYTVYICVVTNYFYYL
mgnify:FL=1